MKKVFLLLIMASILCIAANLQAQTKIGVIIAKFAKVHEKPDEASKLLRTLTKNVEVIIKSESAGWYYVEVDDKTGWIKSNEVAIKVTPVEEPKPTKTEETYESKTEKETTTTTETYESRESYEETTYSKVLRPYYSGLRAGFNLANLGGDDAPDGAKSRFGLVGGGFVVLNFGNYIALQPELLYSQKGAKPGDSTIKLDYIELPVLIRATLPVNFIAEPFITVGPYVAYNINAALKFDTLTYIYDNINKLDYGISIGGGLLFNLGGNLLMLDARYTMGLTTIIKKNTVTIDRKNETIFISLGLAF